MKNPERVFHFPGKFIHGAPFCIRHILQLLEFCCNLSFSEKLGDFPNLGTRAAYINTGNQICSNHTSGIFLYQNRQWTRIRMPFTLKKHEV